MGQEISSTHFSPQDYKRFAENLKAETQQLKSWCDEGRLSHNKAIVGLEMEAWLVNKSQQPAPLNDTFLATLDDPLVVPELAKFNIELNVAPQPIKAYGLRTLHQELDEVWKRCINCANSLNSDALLIGILPTVQDYHLVIDNMSSMKRYKVLNAQIMAARHGKPLDLDILGLEHLHSTHYDVMLESAATSFQLHLQVPLSEAKAYYNASIIASAPLIALAANAPYLFGKNLWAETRIPLFEQAVEVGGYHGASGGPVKRVTFGSSYVRDSIFECFQENLDHYPILIPFVSDNEKETLPHLRFHNGTIWRWNRPLLGFDDDGTPHFRIEHRVIPSGPTIIDEIANAAVYYGLVSWLCGQETPPESVIPFTNAKANFYDAARLGMNAQIHWLDQNKTGLRNLILDKVLPAAECGLKRLEVDADDIQRYLGIIDCRVRSGRNGCHWQRRYIEKFGPDMANMTKHYIENQKSGIPVHHWPI